ncbi:MAG: GntR family transcriptional regulator [Aquabacterium sp.]|nr:GntR family transcriptional regulator [Aquabacterium sp.]
MDGGALFVVQSILRLWLVVAGLLDPITVVTPLSASSPVSDELLSEVPQGVGVSAPSFSPLYQQIKGLILRGLQAGEWRPGEAIPSEIDLAARYKVSQGTVRKAIDELAAENLLMRRQGKGTFVSTHAEERVQYRFLRLTPDLPIQQEPSQREFLDCRRLKAPADVAKVLSLPLGGDVIEIRRVLSFSGRPVVLDDIWLPGHMFKGLTAERLSQYQGPMYGLFESEFGVRMIRAEEKLRAVLADESVAPLLKVAPGSPLLSVERLSRTYDDQPVELRRGLYLTDQHHYRNELS